MWSTELNIRIVTRTLLLVAIPIVMPFMASQASPTSVNTDTIINLPLADTWQLFTTDNGLKSMGYQQVDIELKLGGNFHVANNVVGDEVINATILSYEPEHMLSLRYDNDHWSVFYLTAMGRDMTAIKWVELSSADNIAINAASQFHRKLFDQLIRKYAPECHVCKEEREAAHQ